MSRGGASTAIRTEDGGGCSHRDGGGGGSGGAGTAGAAGVEEGGNGGEHGEGVDIKGGRLGTNEIVRGEHC